MGNHDLHNMTCKYLQVKTELKQNGVVTGTLQVKVSSIEPPRYVFLSTTDMTMRYASNSYTLLHGNDARKQLEKR